MRAEIWNLRTRFIELGYIKVRSPYFTKYLHFIDNALDKPLKFGHLHHCIPVSYYKTAEIHTRLQAEQLANADQNNILIRLNKQEHILAHCLLACTTTNKAWQQANLYAIAKWLNKDSITLKWCRQHINNSSQKTVNKLRCWVNNGIEQKKIYKLELTDYLNAGWLKGMIRKNI